MSKCFYHNLKNQVRHVGDPVDVVTGANTDASYDFELTGPINLVWNRYYNSSHNKWQRSLGWGHSHEFDRWLQYDLDGLKYIDPEGEESYFPPIQENDTVASDGMHLTRIDQCIYRLQQRNSAAIEFELTNTDLPAPCRRLIQGKHSIAFYYSKQGYMKGIVDSLGRLIDVEHDKLGRITNVALRTSEAGKDTHRILLKYRYDPNGNLIEGVDAYGSSFSFAYDQANRLIRKTDRRGYSFLYEYDKYGRCVHSTGEDGLHEVFLEYSPGSKTTIVNKADGGKWTYLYDDDGFIIQITDPYEGVKVFKKGDDGQILEEIDPNGNRTKYLYDSAGAPIGKTDSLGYFSPLPEDPNLPHPLDHRVGQCPAEWEYGDLINWRAITLPKRYASSIQQLPDYAKQIVRTEEHSSTEHRSKSIDRRGSDDSQEVRDECGLLIKENDPAGRSRKYTYDKNGNVRHYKDYEGSEFTNEYFSWNLKASETDPLGHTVSYEYTATEKIAAVVDPGGTRSEYRYDLKDRLTHVYRHGVLKEEYRYDKADNLIEKLDGEGNTLLSFEIGPNNLKKVRRLASGENHYFDYDDKGRFTRAATDEFEATFAYDEFGHRIQDKRDGLGVEHVFEGDKLVETTILDRFVIKYSYREDGKIVIQDPCGQSHTISLLGDGLVHREMANGASEVSQYDAEGRSLAKSTSLNVGLNPWDRQYHYSPEGDLLEVKDNYTGSVHYTYDAAHRLTGSVLSNGESELIKYDDAGNLLNKIGLSGATIGDGNKLSAANGARFKYNDRNHIVAREAAEGVIQYHYDSQDKLTRIEMPDGEWTAQYDPLGRRISKNTNQNCTKFFWDTDRLTAQVFENGRLRIFVYPDHFALTPILSIDYESLGTDPKTGQSAYIFCNHLGAPALVTDGKGNTLRHARSEPYGIVTVGEKKFDMPLRFPGHYFDNETRLQYNRFRYYSPELGRYIQSDPLGIGGGLNLYAYTDNPLVQVDVRGVMCPGDGDGKGDGDVAEGGPVVESPDAKRARLKALAEERRKQRRESARQKALNEAIDKADSSGKLDKLSDEDRAWLESNPRHKELAIDPDGDGSYRVEEAKAALQAEQEGTIAAPVRRATKEADPSEAGADFIDGDDKTWDHKDASMGAEDIAKTADPPRGDKENVLVDARNMDESDRKNLSQDVDDRLGSDSGDVVFVPKE